MPFWVHVVAPSKHMHGYLGAVLPTKMLHFLMLPPQLKGILGEALSANAKV
jgi:hypothetical protein